MTPTPFLHPETVLQRVPDLRLHIDATNAVRLLLPGEDVDCGPHGLAVLEAFAVPRPLGQVLQRHAGTAQEWILITSVIWRLVGHGVLVRPDGERPTAAPSSYAFDHPGVHVLMLDDRTRTSTYLTAIREVVRPGDVVVDIGTGTGVLAAAAARAGAARVYAIEAGTIAAGARELFRANGVADRVQLLRGWSTRLEAVERADVVISEIIGKDPLDERVLEVLTDVRRRWLAPGGRMLPQRLEIFGTPVSLPDDLERYAFTPAASKRWRSWYGLDFSVLPSACPDTPPTYVKSSTARAWSALAQPLRLADIDLTDVRDTRVDTLVSGPATVDGVVHGVLVHFRLHVTADVVLTTQPEYADDANSWRHALYLTPPRQVSAGEPLVVRYRYRCGSAPDGAELVAPESCDATRATDAR